MYESFFQFQQRPFAATPRSDRYFQAHDIEHAVQTLVRCIERAEGPGLLIGGPGTGKSLVCQLLREKFEAQFHIVTLSDTKLCTRRALLQHILFELGLPYRGLEEGELRLSLIDFLKPTQDTRDGMLLLIDEAHTMPLRLVEEIRMITNLVRDGLPRVRLVLAGAPLLDERLAHPKLESFSQRIAARCYLQPFSYDETLMYVQSQLAAVGGEPSKIMTDDALHAVFQATDGIPRLINQVCDHALLLAHASRTNLITAKGVEEAWAELQQLPAPWQPSTGFSETSTASHSDTIGSVDGKAVPGGIIEFGALEDDAPRVSAAPAVAEIKHSLSDDDSADEPVDLTKQIDVIERQVSELGSTEATRGQSTIELPAGESQCCFAEEADHVRSNKNGNPIASMTSQIDVAASHSVVSENLPTTADNPFDEVFDEEEVVVNRYTAAAPTFASYGPAARESAVAMEMIFEAHKLEGQAAAVQAIDAKQAIEPAPISEGAISDAMEAEPEASEIEALEPETLEPEAAAADSRARVFRVESPDDSDIILVMDDDPPRGRTGNGAARREYRQLFSKLRKGSK